MFERRTVRFDLKTVLYCYIWTQYHGFRSIRPKWLHFHSQSSCHAHIRSTFDFFCTTNTQKGLKCEFSFHRSAVDHVHAQIPSKAFFPVYIISVSTYIFFLPWKLTSSIFKEFPKSKVPNKTLLGLKWVAYWKIHISGCIGQSFPKVPWMGLLGPKWIKNKL